MIIIRRAVNKNKSYTVIFLKGEEPKWIPTSNYEHQRILEIYMQDKPYENIENDFTEFKELFSKLAGKTTLEEYTKKVVKINTNFLKSVLDKEKNRPRINK